MSSSPDLRMLRYIKIGMTKDLHKRMRSLQCGCAYRLRVLCWFSCANHEEANLLEKDLHGVFEKYRVHGEHFEASKNTPIWDFLNHFTGVYGASNHLVYSRIGKPIANVTRY